LPRKCNVCTHPDHIEIDRALVNCDKNKDSLLKIAKRFDSNEHPLSKQSLQRHITGGHLSKKVQAVKEYKDIKEGADIMGMITEAYNETLNILKECREKPKYKDKEGNEKEGMPDNELALKALVRVEKQIEIMGKLLGAFTEKREITGKDGAPLQVTHEYILVKGGEPPARKPRTP
jgi:hypothetical protein